MVQHEFRQVNISRYLRLQRAEDEDCHVDDEQDGGNCKNDVGGIKFDSQKMKMYMSTISNPIQFIATI